MACHEIASLRLALHTVLGDRPEHEKTHEIAELGDVIEQDGPLRSLARANNLAQVKRALDAAALGLEQRVADLDADDPQLGYHRALVVNVRGVCRDMDRIIQGLSSFYLDIEDTHDLMHEIFPGSD